MVITTGGLSHDNRGLSLAQAWLASRCFAPALAQPENNSISWAGASATVGLRMCAMCKLAHTLGGSSLAGGIVTTCLAQGAVHLGNWGEQEKGSEESLLPPFVVVA